jgi:hypothetical protein
MLMLAAAAAGVVLMWWLRDLLPELWTIALVVAVLIHLI